MKRLEESEHAEVRELIALTGCTLNHVLNEREQCDQVLREFRSGQKTIMLSIDRTGKGMETCHSDTIIQYDFPKRDLFVHRIGYGDRRQRNASVVRKPVDILFLASDSTNDMDNLRGFESAFDCQFQTIPLSPNFESIFHPMLEPPREEM